MTFAQQLLAALLLDLLIGDPERLGHPVRWIGRLAVWLESPCRRLIRSPKAAGILAVCLVVGSTGATAWLLIRLAGLLHPLAADAVGVWLIYTSVAARDLVRQSMAIWRALSNGYLIKARRCTARIVGRDTESLDEAGLVRAAVECVAESTVDGVTAPLFFALLGGPVGAITYRAINTLDSTFGYKSDRYLYFGWASARLDDLANWLPARLTAPLLVVAAALTGHSPLRTWRILRRDGRKHESPNAGLAEATMAGALGISLGGVKYYGGEPLQTPVLGEAVYPPRASHIPSANVLMLLAMLLFAGLGLGARALIAAVWTAGRVAI